MFWIILIIIGTILAVRGYIRIDKFNKTCNSDDKKDPVFAVICTIIAVLSCIIVSAQGIDGVTDYPYLANKLAKVKALQTRVIDIKEAHYKCETSGALVAGSIENWKQSTVLSDYISQLATIEADYNGYLKECLAYKETFILCFIGSGWAISDRIYELSPII